MADFLFEIGLEEVPARMIPGAMAELQKRVVGLLTRERLIAEGATSDVFATPRRLAVRVQDVVESQSDVTEEVTGPAVKIAFKDGIATPAAEAFARKNGVAVAELKTTATPKGEYLSATVTKPGRAAAEVIETELPKELAGIYWAKNMYWRAGKPERFVRPVEWMVALLGGAIVPVSFGGKTAARTSYGHRVLGKKFEVASPQSYEAQLRAEFVEPDAEVRRHTIRKALDKVTRTVAGMRWREDEALVDALVHLTEWPAVMMGSFESEYLELPEEVLVTVMRDHQKYFAVEDASGRLAAHFLTVLNITTTPESAAVIREGNERVLRARFNDARFFWQFDQRVPLAERVKLLEHVTFQKRLGSYAQKSERVRVLALKLAAMAAERGVAVDARALDQAATLAKTDLTTELVKEFTELQGQIGGLYATAQGVSATTAEAIYDQYLPASAKDRVPRSTEGALLGLADRMDTISGMFSLGLEPTGSKDPFALRRAANAVVRLLAETTLPLVLSDVIVVKGGDEASAAKLEAFFRERVEFYLRESSGQAYDTVAAVMAAGFDDVRDTAARAQAVTAVRASADFAAISAAFKRMKNILAQQPDAAPSEASSAATTEQKHAAELALELKFATVEATLDELRERRDYTPALEAVATLRPEVDAFFEAVMVNDPDPAVRAARLELLRRIVASVASIADFSEIVSAA
jgi:glycyl-tRNA synthetase beta chain